MIYILEDWFLICWAFRCIRGIPTNFSYRCNIIYNPEELWLAIVMILTTPVHADLEL